MSLVLPLVAPPVDGTTLEAETRVVHLPSIHTVYCQHSEPRHARRFMEDGFGDFVLLQEAHLDGTTHGPF